MTDGPSIDAPALDTSAGPVGSAFASGFTPYPLRPPPAQPTIPATPRRFGRRVTLMAARAITHQPLTHLSTGRVESWDDPFGLDASTIKAGFSEWDPALALLGAESAIVRGRRRWRFPDDDGALEWQVWDNGNLVASGVGAEPVASGSGNVSLTARGPESVLRSRTLGGGEVDLLEGRGSFPTTSLAGWTISNLTTGWTGNSFDGDRALTLEGNGTITTPWVYVPGAPTRAQDIRMAAMVRLPATPSGFLLTLQVTRLDGTPVRPDLAEAGRGEAVQRNDDDWQQVVATSGLPAYAGTYKVRGILRALSTDPIVVDRVVPTQDYSTGSIDALELADFPLRIMTTAQEARSGGWLGITVRKLSNTGVARVQSWSHANNPSAWEALNWVATTAGGPDIWCGPSWKMYVAKRRGSDRLDIALTDDHVIAPVWYTDPQGRVDDLYGLTGFGAGPTRAVVSAIGPPSPGRRRQRRMDLVPAELTFRNAEDWIAGRHEWLQRRRLEMHATTRYSFGERVVTGDGLREAVSSGLQAEWGAARVGNRIFSPPTETCELVLGDDPVVQL